MAGSIAKLNIMLGVDTSGIISGIDGKAVPKIREFKNTVDSLSSGGIAASSTTLAAGFKAASTSIHAMQGSLAGMGSSMGALIAGGPVLIGIAAEVAALFAAAKFAAWGIKLAMGQDAEFIGKWKVFKDEIADLAVKIGELFMPLIKWWLDVGIGAVRAMKGGTIAERGTYDRLTNPEDSKKKLKDAGDFLQLQRETTAELTKQLNSLASGFPNLAGARGLAAEAVASLKDVKFGDKKQLDEYKRNAEEMIHSLKRQMDEMTRSAESITRNLRTPAEVMQDSLRELNTLMDAGLISFQTYSRGIEKAADEYANLNDKAREFQQINARTSLNPTARERGSFADVSSRNKVESIIQAQADTAKQQLATQQRQEKLEQQIRDILKANNVTFQPINLR